MNGKTSTAISSSGLGRSTARCICVLSLHLNRIGWSRKLGLPVRGHWTERRGKVDDGQYNCRWKWARSLQISWKSMAWLCGANSSRKCFLLYYRIEEYQKKLKKAKYEMPPCWKYVDRQFQGGVTARGGGDRAIIPDGVHRIFLFQDKLRTKNKFKQFT